MRSECFHQFCRISISVTCQNFPQSYCFLKFEWSFFKETLVEYQSDRKKFDPMRNLMRLEAELATRNLRFTIQHAKVA